MILPGAIRQTAGTLPDTLGDQKMAKSKIQYTNIDVMVVNTNGTNHVKSTFEIVSNMVREFGASKTQDTIQALYDADRIDQNTAGFLLDALKMFCGKKQSARMFLL